VPSRDCFKNAASRRAQGHQPTQLEGDSYDFIQTFSFKQEKEWQSSHLGAETSKAVEVALTGVFVPRCATRLRHALHAIDTISMI
jgi:hypothetical protein